MKIFLLLAGLFLTSHALIAQSPHAARLYGMTQYGSASSKGSIFHYTPSTNTFTTDYNFQVKAKGRSPKCEIVAGNNGKYYGTTTAGGDFNAGVLFEWDSTTSVYKDLYNFTGSDGKDARGGMILYNNKLYGSTNEGGANNCGVIYEWDIAANTYTKKIDLNSADGKNPTGSLTMINNIFYGFTSEGGIHDKGVLFEWDPATNIYTKRFDFDSVKGSNPVGKLAAYNGKLYAMCNKGGAFNAGTIYQWDYTNNIITKTFDFNNTNGSSPTGYLTLYNNKFYGTTYEGGIYQTGLSWEHYGVIFEYNPVNNAFVKKKDLGFNGGLRGPLGSLTLKDNIFWSTATDDASTRSGGIFTWDPATNLQVGKLTFFVFYEFSACEIQRPPIGTQPFESLLLSGNCLLGSTSLGAGHNFGTLYKFSPDSNRITDLVNMEATDGSYPKGSLTKLGNKLYGLTYQGGNSHSGNIFEWDLSTQQYKERFQLDGLTTGIWPKGSLTYYNGKFYGINSKGKISYGNNFSQRELGDYFSWDPASNVYQSLRSAEDARSTPVLLNDKLYSTAKFPTNDFGGVISAFNPAANTLINAAYFPVSLGNFSSYQGYEGANGVTYYNGKFYGMTTAKISSGSTPFRGTIYEWDTTTTEITHRYDFTDSIGIYPTGNLLLVGNEFYGLTSNYANYTGTYPCLFKWNPATNVLEKKNQIFQVPFGTPTYSGGKIYFSTESSFLNLYEYDPVLDTTINLYTESIPLFQPGGNWNYTNCVAPPSYQQLLEVIPNEAPLLFNIPGIQTICTNQLDSVLFKITDADLDTMHFQINSSNSALLPAANISISNVDSIYTLHYTPALNESGSTIVNIIADDGYGDSVHFSFSILINPLPTVSITSIPASPNLCEGDGITLAGNGADNYTWSDGIINNIGFIPPVGTNTYTVIGTDVNGCSDTSTQTVIVNPTIVPTISIGSNISQGNVGDPIIYTAITNLVSPYTIDWYLNNIFQTTTTSNSWNTNIVSGTNSVKAIISSATQCLKPGSAESNIVEVKRNEGIAVYPNPATEEIAITGLLPNDDISLYNSIGQRILATTGIKILSNQNRLQLKNIAAGTYMLSIKRNEEIFVKKIIKIN